MDFLIEATEIGTVGQACFTCTCNNGSCYQSIFTPVCVKNTDICVVDACTSHCWGNACNPRQDPMMLK